jgi:hypothetical protein
MSEQYQFGDNVNKEKIRREDWHFATLCVNVILLANENHAQQQTIDIQPRQAVINTLY